MYLEVDGYKFPMYVQKDWDPTVVDVFVGNPSCSHKPCMVLTVFDKANVVINEVMSQDVPQPSSLL